MGRGTEWTGKGGIIEGLRDASVSFICDRPRLGLGKKKYVGELVYACSQGPHRRAWAMGGWPSIPRTSDAVPSRRAGIDGRIAVGMEPLDGEAWQPIAGGGGLSVWSSSFACLHQVLDLQSVSTRASEARNDRLQNDTHLDMIEDQSGQSVTSHAGRLGKRQTSLAIVARGWWGPPMHAGQKECKGRP